MICYGLTGSYLEMEKVLARHTLMMLFSGCQAIYIPGLVDMARSCLVLNGKRQEPELEGNCLEEISLFCIMNGAGYGSKLLGHWQKNQKIIQKLHN